MPQRTVFNHHADNIHRVHMNDPAAGGYFGNESQKILINTEGDNQLLYCIVQLSFEKANATSSGTYVMFVEPLLRSPKSSAWSSDATTLWFTPLQSAVASGRSGIWSKTSS